jgi:hypothetical protein
LTRTDAAARQVAEIEGGRRAAPEELIALKSELATLSTAKPELPNVSTPADFDRYAGLVAQQQPRSGSIYKG